MNKLFADNRQKVIAAIREWGAETGTAEVTVNRIIDSLLPAIRLSRKKGGGTAVRGSCREGGLPDLPDGVPWPRVDPADETSMPMSLVLQVNLAEVAGFDVNKVLPAGGLLSLFFYWDDDGGEEEGRVMYFPAPLPPLRRPKAPADLPEENRYQAHALEPRPEWTLPGWRGLDLPEEDRPDLEPWFDLHDRVAQVQGLASEETGHQMLGYPDLIQSSRLDEGRVLLLQAGPDYSADSRMQWGDGGMLYCTLTEAELRAGQLDRAELMLEMC